MKFRVISKKTSTDAHSPIQVVEQSTGKGVVWINRYLDREYVRRLSNKSLFTYAHSLLHFVRWWESVHQTGVKSPPPNLPNRRCSITCASSRVGNLRLLPPPSTIASPVPIVLSATSSPMLPVRSRTASISPSCTADRWAWDAPGSS